jgi:hypothetical protein
VKDDSLSKRALQVYEYGKFQASAFAPYQPVLIPWNSPEGMTRLHRAELTAPFFSLAHFYQPQLSPVYCGVASAVMVLNALRCPKGAAPLDESLAIRLPESGELLPLKAYSQLGFFSDKTEKVKRRKVIEYQAKDASGHFRPGLSLGELSDLLMAHGLEAVAKFASTTDESHFRSQLAGAMKTHAYCLIHFRCDLLGGVPRGHISPLGAWDTESDSVLVMDVASHKTPWYWAPVRELFMAMAATYDTQPKGGGWALVRELEKTTRS